MGILNAHQVEVLLPVGPLLVERDVAKANFDPANGSVVAQPCVGHIAQILIACNGAIAQPARLDRLEQFALSTRFDSGSDEITHGVFPVSVSSEAATHNYSPRIAASEGRTRESPRPRRERVGVRVAGSGFSEFVATCGAQLMTLSPTSHWQGEEFELRAKPAGAVVQLFARRPQAGRRCGDEEESLAVRQRVKTFLQSLGP